MKKEEKSKKVIKVEIVFSEDENEKLDDCLEKLIEARFEALKRAICNSNSV